MLTSTLTLAKTGLGVGNAIFVDQILSSVQYSRLTKDEKDNILRWIQGFNYDEEHLLGGLKKIFEDVNLPVYFVNHVDICYEKVMDELGDIYARELHTGLLFPLVGHMCKFGEFDWSKNKTTNHFERNTSYYEVKHIYQLCNKSIQPILSYVSGDKVIGKDEVKEYLKSMEALKENSIKGCYDKNVIDSEIIIKDLDKKLAEKDLVSLYIEDIELSLFKLENLNEDLYTHALDYYHAIINSRNSDIDNDVNAHKRNSYIINYKKRNSNEHLNEISYTAGIQNDQKQNYILKNVRHIYKKNRQALNEKKCKIMKINKIDEINSHSFINNDKNKNYTFIKENINKNEEDIKKEIDEENYNKNINNNTYKNLKYFYNMNMTNNIYSNNNNYNTPLLSKSKLTRINSDFLNSCKLQLNNKNGNSDENICFSFYNNLIPKDKIKTNINNENNKYSDRSFKIENHTHHHKMYNKPHMINIKALPYNGKFKSIESEKSPIKDKKIINKNEFIIEFFEILIDISNSINNRNLFGN